ncbi:MAG: DUF2059 domain-containing protein [Rhizobiales bacterium]|nr:DUF2059 domain-containing protein [Hyphomicrobiales bacterium]MBN9009794.1 DUF2059 domain-containing protein [Hyphomicrobiales bacterium]
MRINRFFLRAAVLGWAAVAVLAGPARADEITPSHLQAALEVITASKLGTTYDAVLPEISASVQSQLIRLRPDLYQQISDTVNDVALALVSRRTDLNNDVARIWANAFTEDELKVISTFYRSPAGQKFLAVSPKVVFDSSNALKGWSQRVSEEMMEKSREALKQQGVEF